jgi:hypothetical protein
MARDDCESDERRSNLPSPPCRAGRCRHSRDGAERNSKVPSGVMPLPVAT